MTKRTRAYSARSLLAALFFSFVVVLGSSAPRTAWASSTGVSGYSGNPATNAGAICTDCHTGGPVPAVVLSGPTSLPTGSTGVYTFTITGGAAVNGGLDVSTTNGTLSATGSNTKLLSNEITHSSAPLFSAGSLAFTFSLKAPSTAGSLTLYGSGLSSDGTGSFDGDNAVATTLAVTVTTPLISITDPIGPPDDLTIPFGTYTNGIVSDQTITVGNNGSADLVIGTIASANSLAAPFSIATDNCSGRTISPAGTCTLIVRFAPTAAGSFSDTFDIPSNDTTTGSVVISVSGTGTTSVISITDPVSPTNDLILPFGQVTDGLFSDQTITVGNNGTSDLIIGTIALANPLAAPFGITTDNCSGQTIAPSGSCSLIIRYAPTAAGPFSDSFDIPSNDPITPSAVVSVSGTVNNPPTTPTLVSPADGASGVKTTITLNWNRSRDLDGDTISYYVYYCTDSTFATCSPVLALQGATGIYFAGSGLLFLGFVMTRGGRGRKFLLVLMIGLLLTIGGLMSSCGNVNIISPPSVTKGNMSYQVLNLSSATTYYWKVVADDGKGGQTSSNTWSFTTQ